MARRAVLGGGSLNPFGGAAVDFGSFNIGAAPASASQAADEAAAAAKREAQLTLNSAEIRWNAGQMSNAEYLAALQQYAGSADAGTPTGQDAIARVDTYQYRFERDLMVSQVESGGASLADLVAFDRSKLSGLVQDSEEYQQRLGYYQSSQSALFNELESTLVDQYNNGQMTTAQLSEQYLALGNDPLFNDNVKIRKSVEGRLGDLQDRIVAEVDSKMLTDYQNGKITPQDFMAYGASARARYAAGTDQFTTWTERMNSASDKLQENALLYRYDLSQKYAELSKFVQSSKPPKGGTSTSTRTVLGANGQWKVVKSTTATAPSASELQAYAARQREVASAKSQMAEIEGKMIGAGGYVSTASTILYYQKQLGKYALGTDEWYAVQGKLDDLADRSAAEKLLASQGIRVSYPRTAAQTATVAAKTGSGKATAGKVVSAAATASGSSGPSKSVGLDSFMAALAHVESGSRYTAQNKQSGAFGKYQIMPANWAGWAKKYIGDPGAAQTPENQEKVAKGKIADLYKWLGDWNAVAHWWLTGGSKEAQTNPAAWSTSSRRYVDNVMAGVGQGPTSGSALAAKARTSGAATMPSGGTVSPSYAPKPPAGKATVAKAAAPSMTGPLRILTGVTQKTRTGPQQAVTAGASFPTGMDSKAFDNFYSQYQGAFQNTTDAPISFTVATPHGSTNYWIGDDPAERIDLMRNMDELRINMYRAQLGAYGPTESGYQTAANKYDQALEDAARHEIMILDTAAPKGSKSVTPSPVYSPNTLAQGLSVLDKAKTAIADYLSLADDAFKRGDLTAAYSYHQLALARATRSSESLRQFAAVAEAKVSQIEGAYQVGRDEALGGKADAFQADLSRLKAFGAELDAATNPGAKGLADLLKIVAKDPTGEPKFDSPGPGGQIVLDQRYHFEVSPGGAIEAVLTKTSLDPQTGKRRPVIEGKVYVDYLTGTKTIGAYVTYKVDNVGWFVDASGQRIDMKGKTYQRELPSGGEETWYEDPFSGKWSNNPIIYNPGSGFKAVMKPGAAPGSAPIIQYQRDGWTYSMVSDSQSGTYVASRHKDGGLSGPVDEELGSVRTGTQGLDSFQKAGFARDLSGLSEDDRWFAQMDAPFVGGTVKQYRDWKFNFQSPFKNLVGAKAQGGRDDVYVNSSLTGNLGRTGPAIRSPQAVNASDDRASLLAEKAYMRQLATPVLRALTPLTGLTKTTIAKSTAKKPVAASVTKFMSTASKDDVYIKPIAPVTPAARTNAAKPTPKLTPLPLPTAKKKILEYG